MHRVSLRYDHLAEFDFQVISDQNGPSTFAWRGGCVSRQNKRSLEVLVN